MMFQLDRMSSVDMPFDEVVGVVCMSGVEAEWD
jgi:hypothetical protein